MSLKLFKAVKSIVNVKFSLFIALKAPLWTIANNYHNYLKHLEIEFEL